MAPLLGGGAVLGAFPSPKVASHEIELSGGETLVLCTDGWLEAGPPEAHCQPEALAKMAHELSTADLDELTRRLCRDALARGDGSLRDDMVVLALRPTAPEPPGDGEDLRERLLQATAE